MTRRANEGGYALITILFMAAVLLVMLGTAIPRVLTQGQREKEEELIFRGEQYARAVRLYFRKYGRFPNELDDLVRVNNNVRFLRKLYKDPMNPDGHWRLIHVGAGGRLQGNVVERPPLKIPPPAPAVRPAMPPETPPQGTELPAPQAPAPPEPPQPAPQTEQPQQQPAQPAGPPTGKWPLPAGVGQPAEGTAPPESQPAGEQQQTQPPPSPYTQVVPGGGKQPKPQPGQVLTDQPSPIPGLPPQTVPPEPGKQPPGEEERPGFNPEEEAPSPEEPAQAPPQPTTSPVPFTPAPAPGGAQRTPVSEAEPQVFGAGIVGVASNSTRESIRIYRGHTRYNEWEFIYDPGAEIAGVALMPGQPGTQPPGKQPGISPPGGFAPFGPPTKR